MVVVPYILPRLSYKSYTHLLNYCGNCDAAQPVANTVQIAL